MKVLFMEWKSFGNEDMICALKSLGHEVHLYPFSNVHPRNESEFEASLSDTLHTLVPDFIFSFNYFPIISMVCKKENIPYISWVYDSPYVLLYSYTIINPCNYVFVFDKTLYLEFHNAGIKTIHYLPMAANTSRLEAMNDMDLFSNSQYKNVTPISFIGSLYTEKHQFFNRLEGISPYTQGYLDGIMAAQSKVYGYNFIQEILPSKIMDDMYQFLPMEPNSDGVESKEFLYSQYVINRQITALERTEVLSSIGNQFGLDLYTSDKNLLLSGVVNHGPIDYYDMAPYVFKNSKINLNISLRSIQSGMPLRAFDIMGSGGFLLTNYQADFMDFFNPGEDFVYYDSHKDLLSKIRYYLDHEDERSAIAANGLQQIKSAHTYEHRIVEILTYI